MDENEEVELPTALSPSDFQFLKKAMKTKREADVVLSAVTQHLAEVYSLDSTCKIDDATGAIKRTPPEPRPAPEPLGGRD